MSLSRLKPLAGWFLACVILVVWRRDLLLPGTWANRRSDEGLVFRKEGWEAYSDFDV